jgi:hypothetical protein
MVGKKYPVRPAWMVKPVVGGSFAFPRKPKASECRDGSSTAIVKRIPYKYLKSCLIFYPDRGKKLSITII